MGTLFGFAVGYILGARAGQEGFDEVVRSVRAIRSSEEFRSFVVAMKAHSQHLLREVTGRIAGEEEEPAFGAFGNGGGHRPTSGF